MTKTIKAEYLPGGAKRQEMLDTGASILGTPGADQETKHHFCLEVSKDDRDGIPGSFEQSNQRWRCEVSLWN